MSEQDQQKAAGIALGSGALASILTLIATRRASGQSITPADIVGLDEAAMTALLNLLQNAQDINQHTTDILQAIASVTGAGGLQNPDNFITFRHTPAVAFTPEQLPPYDIPYKHALVVKAYHTNAGTMFIARTLAGCVQANIAYALIANEAVELEIKNSESIWVMANTAGDSVNCIVEQR